MAYKMPLLRFACLDPGAIADAITKLVGSLESVPKEGRP